MCFQSHGSKLRNNCKARINPDSLILSMIFSKRLVYLISFSLMLISISSCTRKQGCIDPNAWNYDFEAHKDDGSCIYSSTIYTDTDHGLIDIFLNDNYEGTISYYYPITAPLCGENYSAVTLTLFPGNYELVANAGDGTQWKTTLNVEKNCRIINLDRPL